YQDIDDDTPTGIGLDKKSPVRDFANKLIQRVGPLNASPDPINRCDGAFCSGPGLSSSFAQAEQALSRLTSRPAAGLKVIDQLPEATVLRIEYATGKRVMYSMLRNRAHTNVAFLLGESYRYIPVLDTLSIYPGVLSSSPNFMFNVPAAEVPAFVDAMQQSRDRTSFEQIVQRWGIRRTHP
ncbi:fatty acid cis/trans isomerase, partial [Pseudomonas amygdali]|uniref:fatty acid cis/trans isomerase n=1 Tax=Pseudomonas amygdali TaxID=47877 RepID=UPI0015E1A1B1